MANYDFGTSQTLTSYTGLTGIFTASNLLMDFDPYPGAYYDLNFGIQNSTSGVGDMTSTASFVSDFNQHQVDYQNMINVDATGDDTSYEITPSFDVYFDNTSYSSFYLGSNGYITFGGPATTFNVSASVPNLPKVMVSAQDLRIRYYGAQEFGTSPNKVIKVTVVGRRHTGATHHRYKYHYKMYEQYPNKMDLYIERNDNYQTLVTSGTGSLVDGNYSQPTFSTLSDITFTPTTSIARLTTPRIPINFSNFGTGTAFSHFRGRRPSRGQLYPRGVYNK